MAWSELSEAMVDVLDVGGCVERQGAESLKVREEEKRKSSRLHSDEGIRMDACSRLYQTPQRE